MFANFNTVLSVHPPEWREKWFSLIPGGRLCDPSELKGVSDIRHPTSRQADR